MTRAEDPVRHIAEEGKAGDQDHHQPELLRVPGAVGTVVATRQERQDGSGNHRKAGKGLYVLFVELSNEPMHLLLERQDQGDDGRADDRQGRIAAAGQEPEADRGHARDWARRIGTLREIRTVPVANAQNCSSSGNQGAARERLAETADQTGNARQETEQSEGPNASNTRALGHVPKIEAPFESNQQPAGNGGADPQGICVPLTDQRSPSTHALDATAMVVVATGVKLVGRTCSLDRSHMSGSSADSFRLSCAVPAVRGSVFE